MEADQTLTVKIDATAPTNVAGTPARQPDSNGWYNHAVAVTFAGQDATSGIASCTQGASYSGPDSATASVAGTCTDNAGNVGTGSFALKYDATKPTVTYTGNAGSYTVDQTVSITCAAADNLSGVASSTCAHISGPASSFKLGTNSYSATATDKAGNVGSGQTSFVVRVTGTSLGELGKRFTGGGSAGDGLANLAQALEAAAPGDERAQALQNYIITVQHDTPPLTAAQAQTLIGLARALAG